MRSTRLCIHKRRVCGGGNNREASKQASKRQCKRADDAKEGWQRGGREEKWDPPTSLPARGSGSNCPNPPPVRDHLLVEELAFLGER